MVKLKKTEKRDKYHDLARELKKLWSITLTAILIVIGALGKISKGLVEDLERRGRLETIQTTALLILEEEESWRLGQTWCHSDSNEKPSTKSDVKTSQKSRIIIL